jgi:hypothetical protein
VKTRQQQEERDPGGNDRAVVAYPASGIARRLTVDSALSTRVPPSYGKPSTNFTVSKFRHAGGRRLRLHLHRQLAIRNCKIRGVDASPGVIRSIDSVSMSVVVAVVVSTG